MGKYKKGDRVFDTFCSEYGMVAGHYKDLVKVEYDQDCGCDSNLDLAEEKDLELCG